MYVNAKKKKIGQNEQKLFEFFEITQVSATINFNQQFFCNRLKALWTKNTNKKINTTTQYFYDFIS